MPKIVITDARGLVQETGSGIEVNSKGVCGVAYSGATAVSATAGNTDMEISVPANALIMAVGLVCTTVLDGTSNTPNVNLTAGTAAGGQQYVASTVVVSAGSMSVGTSISTDGATAESTNTIALVSNVRLHNTAARTVHMRVVTSANLDTAGEVVGFVRYAVI